MPVSFDKNITNKIRETFERYEEPFNEHAWALMREKLDQRKRRGGFWTFGIAKAASVILIVGLGILIPYSVREQKADRMPEIMIPDSADYETKFKGPDQQFTAEQFEENAVDLKKLQFEDHQRRFVQIIPDTAQKDNGLFEKDI
jgi:hypothetical protein